MKNILRRVNRGLVLAGVLLIGLIIYIIVDNAAFAKELPNVEKSVRDYAAAAENLLVLPEQYRVVGHTYTEEEWAKAEPEIIKSLYSQIDEISEKYLTKQTMSRQWLNCRDRLKAHVDNDIKAAFLGNAMQSVKYELVNVTNLRKAGPGMIKCDIRIKAEFMVSGRLAMWMLYDNIYPDYGYYDPSVVKNSGDDPIEMQEPTMNAQSVTIHDVTMVKEDGVWRGVSCNGMSWGSN